LTELPALTNLPVTEKEGWPWNFTPEPNPAFSKDVVTWPKISIITPSYNQALFLEETIRSVLYQGYPNLEYIIIDGGSSDGSVEIIKKYEPWLSYWVSELDSGQSQAINKGFYKCTGEIIAWINSDDYYAPGAFFYVASAFMNNPTLWVAGLVDRIDAEGKILIPGKLFEESLKNWYVGAPYLQPGIFWSRALWEKAGKLDESLHYSFDYDLLMRFIQYQPFAYWINHKLANFRIHAQSKSGKDQLKFMPERQKIYRKYSLAQFSNKERFYIWKKRRERKSRIIMELKGKLPFVRILWKIFCSTPWFFFRKNFLYWIYKNWNK